MASSSRRVAAVTGANKGIGLAIVKGLCEGWKGDAYLTARDERRGRGAPKELGELGQKPIFHPLDVTDEDSARRFRDRIASEYGRIDVLVNNAVAAFKSKDPTPTSVQAEMTTFVNYFSLVSVCDILFLFLGPGSRVRRVGEARDERGGRLGILVLRRLEGRRERPDLRPRQGIRTAGRPRRLRRPGLAVADTSSKRGDLTPEKGARAPLLLAMVKDEKGKDFKGVFMWFDCTPIDWYADV